MAQAAKPSEFQRATIAPAVQNLMSVIQKRRSVRVYKTGKVSDAQLNIILEAARWAPSGANTQPWEFVVTRDRKKMRRIREIYDNEWRQRKREDPVNYKGLKKDYVGDVSVIVLACGDPRTKTVYLTTRQQGDREKLFQASMANAVQQMMLAVREEVEPELRELFRVPEPLRLLWVVPIGHAQSWPKAKPRRKISDFTHMEVYDSRKLRSDSEIRPWPKN
jgi:5,6-dimethylbenzimidazole synthase